VYVTPVTFRNHLVLITAIEIIGHMLSSSRENISQLYTSQEKERFKTAKLTFTVTQDHCYGFGCHLVGHMISNSFLL